MSFLMNAASELNLQNKDYLRSLDQFVWQTYLADNGSGDVTSDAFLGRANPVVTAQVMAKEDGVFAGVQEVEWFLKKSKIELQKSKKEGLKIKKGELVMELKGRAKAILAAERTLLNLLQRMSGIATLTAEMKSKMPKNIQLLATRKTFWGDLDKRAVCIGGGATHRLNLADAILIKENHIALSDDVEESLLSSFEKADQIRFIEMELETLAQVKWLADFLDHYEYPKNFVVMLDNFKPANIKKAVEILKSYKITIEASGGIGLESVKKYCITGLSAISSGSIINKAKALDLSLQIDSSRPSS